jgi:hypothetical protein
VTNFTSLVGDLKGLGTREVCIFTSEEHLPRALRIGRLVLGAEGMAVRGFAVEHDKSPEPPPPESVWRSTRCVKEREVDPYGNTRIGEEWNAVRDDSSRR